MQKFRKRQGQNDVILFNAKKLVSVLLSLAIILSLFTAVPLSVSAEDGEYDIDGDGVLTLYSGYFDNTSFLGEDMSSVTSVCAEPGVCFEGDCSGMFSDCVNCTEIDLSDADMSEIENVEEMFSGCSLCESIIFPDEDISLGSSTREMFADCASLTGLDLSGFDTSEVTDMSYMFSHCSVTQLDLSSFDTSNVITMAGMFEHCEAMSSIDLSGFDTKKVVFMTDMFNYCIGLKKLDISSFDTSRVTSFAKMFEWCFYLQKIFVGDGWTVTGANGTDMFNSCRSIVGARGTAYYSLEVGAERAHIDGGDQDPGYLSKLVNVTWNNYDGELLKAERVEIGSTPSYTGEPPERQATDGYTYTFSGWSPQVGEVNADAVYTAQFTETAREYTVTWKNDDGTVIEATQVPYGELPEHEAPEKPDEGSTTFIFMGWEPEPTAVTGDAEYTAVFTSVVVTDWSLLQSQIDGAPDGTATEIMLTKDFTATEDDTALVIPSGKVITLDLNGHTIDRDLYDKSAVSGGNVITNNGTLVITGDGTVKGGNNSQNGGAIVNNGTLTIEGGAISDSKTTKDGGAVYNSGTLNITGGTVSGSRATGSGGAVSAHSGVINMSGGTVSGNSAGYHGGAFYLGLDSNAGTEAVMNLMGGVITGNSSGRQSDRQGGGVLNNGTLNVSGSPVVKGNTGSKGKNIYLRPGHGINVTGSIIENARLGVTLESGGGLGVFTTGLTDHPSELCCFFSDMDRGYIDLSAGGEAVVKRYAATDALLELSKAREGEIISGSFFRVIPGDKEYGIRFISGRWGRDGVMSGGAELSANRLLSGIAGVENGTININGDEYAPYDISGAHGDKWIVEKIEDGFVYLKGVGTKLIAGSTLSLNGDIYVNFFIDPACAGAYISDFAHGETLDVRFSWATEPAPSTDLSKFSVTIDSSNYRSYLEGQYFIVSCRIAAAEMSCKIRAEAELGDLSCVLDYSVRDYAAVVLDPDSLFSRNYVEENGAEKYGKLCELVTQMLNYGARAQEAFDVNTGDLANSIVPEGALSPVTAEMCRAAVRRANNDRQGDDFSAIDEPFGSGYCSTSLIYLSSCTLRHYFLLSEEAYEAYSSELDDSKAPYYYVEKADISAAELDDLQTFVLGGEEYYYSALDYAAAVIEDGGATEAGKELAKALYRYNQAANGYFD